MLFNIELTYENFVVFFFEIKMLRSSKSNLKLGKNEDGFSFIYMGNHLDKNCSNLDILSYVYRMRHSIKI